MISIKIIIIYWMSEKIKNCYDYCNAKYTPMQPERLFCKKGCDSDEDSMYFSQYSRQSCKTDTCNKICIKEEQGEQKLFFSK